MTSDVKPLKVWGSGGANPPKVNMILEELNIPYEVIPVFFSDVKNPEYTIINPNGRLPSLQDPNTDITIWESGAILEYLVEKYDSQHLISFAPGTPEYYHAKQWLYFQTSGQGPYYGQAAWFKKFHHEKLPSAFDRYVKEMYRVNGVLEGWLAKQKEEHSSTDGPWLVGNKLSYADLAFVPWQRVIGMVIPEEEYNLNEYPLLKEWVEKILARNTVQRAIDRSQQVSH